VLGAWAAADMPGQQGRTALVTGANSGIGFQVALELARHGAQVLLACRDTGRGTRARDQIAGLVAGAAVELVALDLADLDSVERLAGQITALDLLVNNAGVMAVPRRQVTAQGFELQFGVNHLGHFALTGRLLPVLLGRPGSRVVTVSSIVHRFGSIRLDDLNSERRYRGWRAYGQSKLANALFTLELDRRLRTAGTDTSSVGAHPGYSSTGLMHSGPRLGGGGIVAHVMGMAAPFTGQPAALGALPVLRAATDPGPAAATTSGPAGRASSRALPAGSTTPGPPATRRWPAGCGRRRRRSPA
jgi:NAD(P)-dependent dehydrogenase (short-subunit alcohol dehydrogenase family)